METTRRCFDAWRRAGLLRRTTTTTTTTTTTDEAVAAAAERRLATSRDRVASKRVARTLRAAFDALLERAEISKRLRTFAAREGCVLALDDCALTWRALREWAAVVDVETRRRADAAAAEAAARDERRAGNALVAAFTWWRAGALAERRSRAVADVMHARGFRAAAAAAARDAFRGWVDAARRAEAARELSKLNADLDVMRTTQTTWEAFVGWRDVARETAAANAADAVSSEAAAAAAAAAADLLEFASKPVTTPDVAAAARSKASASASASARAPPSAGWKANPTFVGGQDYKRECDAAVVAAAAMKMRSIAAAVQATANHHVEEKADDEDVPSQQNDAENASPLPLGGGRRHLPPSPKRGVGGGIRAVDVETLMSSPRSPATARAPRSPLRAASLNAPRFGSPGGGGFGSASPRGGRATTNPFASCDEGGFGPGPGPGGGSSLMLSPSKLVTVSRGVLPASPLSSARKEMR